MKFFTVNVGLHAALLSVVIACQEARPSKAISPSARVSSAEASSSGGDHGGEGGAGAGNDGAGSALGGASATGSAAGGAAGDGATDGDDDVASACAEDRAFAAVSWIFVEPTPPQLAERLNDAGYDRSPISFVLFAGSASDGELAASYTVVGESGAETWPASREPEASEAWLQEFGFGASAAQEEGWMLVNGGTGLLEVHLRNLRVTATTNAECTRGTATLVAVVPAEWSDVLDEIAPGSASRAASTRGDVASDVTISAEFGFEQVEFDFRGSR